MNPCEPISASLADEEQKVRSPVLQTFLGFRMKTARSGVARIGTRARCLLRASAIGKKAGYTTMIRQRGKVIWLSSSKEGINEDRMQCYKKLYVPH